ncbi:MAG TPA: hypothetical protein VGV89_00735 [Thermoplasmata archaeon]|nr:hypothetical protein [Thermoplasmata archaeon]
MPTKKPVKGFSAEEKAAMRERVREMKARATREEGERDVQAKIEEMNPSDRALGQRLHALVKANAPQLAARTWYGMPAYSNDDDIVLYFRPAEKFKTRYATLGFSDEAKLDEGSMWPTEFALTAMTRADEDRIVALLKRALA